MRHYSLRLNLAAILLLFLVAGSSISSAGISAAHIAGDADAPSSLARNGIERTNNSLDLAIQGPGYLRIVAVDPLGDGTLYTRKCSFTISQDDDLVVNVGRGYKLCPPIKIPLGTTPDQIGVSQNGTITLPWTDHTRATVAQFQLCTFPHPDRLELVGGCFYRETKASGPPLTQNPGAPNAGYLLQHFLELLPAPKLIDPVTRFGSVQIDLSEGNLKYTNNPLNVAIKGAGFVRVITRTNQGQTMAYTRHGLLSINSNDDGLLLGTADGDNIVPPLKVPVGTTADQIKINPDGIVYTVQPLTNCQLTIGQIQLWAFSKPELLKPIGNGLYQPTDASGPATPNDPTADCASKLLQNYLELPPTRLPADLK
ncbi:MAG: hypothetical protein ABSH22_13520 [Tepidisphaeraceae bacterium]|jgi:flagellar basal body rod protein FlgG